jgi:hypothetical protein
MGLTECTRLWLQVTVVCGGVAVSAFEQCNKSLQCNYCYNNAAGGEAEGSSMDGYAISTVERAHPQLSGPLRYCWSLC